MNLILASQSPRRRELLALLRLSFTPLIAPIDEGRALDESPTDHVQRLSREKALAAARLVDGAALILAADTIVVDGSEVLGKPADAAEAASMLRRLRGRQHRVYTAVTLFDTTNGYSLTELVDSPVQMRPYTEQEIAAYVAGGDPLDKAGAYAIQHKGFDPAQDFDHCLANVMGLPLCHVARMLRQLEIEPMAHVPTVCQAALHYTCLVHRTILPDHDR